jgi:hypothetical protein
LANADSACIRVPCSILPALDNSLRGVTIGDALTAAIAALIPAEYINIFANKIHVINFMSIPPIYFRTLFYFTV